MCLESNDWLLFSLLVDPCEFIKYKGFLKSSGSNNNEIAFFLRKRNLRNNVFYSELNMWNSYLLS